MTNIEFVEKLKLALNQKTLYVSGCFGAPMNNNNKKRYSNNNTYNRQPARQKMIEKATADTFGFDCVCLIKGILWGWNADKNKQYGGAEYLANNVPDYSEDGMRRNLIDESSDFSKVEIGEFLYMTGHCGIYIGDGKAIECSPKWNNGVQVTGLFNMNSNLNHVRCWLCHGKLKWITYLSEEEQHSWSKPYTDWAIENKIFTGYDDGTYRWEQPISREETAVVLKRLYDKIKE